MSPQGHAIMEHTSKVVRAWGNPFRNAYFDFLFDFFETVYIDPTPIPNLSFR